MYFVGRRVLWTGSQAGWLTVGIKTVLLRKIGFECLMQVKYFSSWESEWWREQNGADTSQTTEVIVGIACTANYPHSLM